MMIGIPMFIDGKGTIVPVLLREHDAMKAYRENGGIAPVIH